MKTLRDSSVALNRKALLTPAVERAVNARLRDSAYLALRTVGSRYHDGVLTLWGSVPSDYLKQLAQVIVADLEGVRKVANEIEVRECSNRGEPEPRVPIAADWLRD